MRGTMRITVRNADMRKPEDEVCPCFFFLDDLEDLTT